MSVLDDVNFVKKYDRSDALGLALNSFEQLEYDFAVATFDSSQIKNVVIAGMGGSALGPKLLMSWLDFAFPLEITSDYGLPGYVGAETLVIVSSFSGNTEETLASMTVAEEKGCKIVAVSNGGELEQRARQAGHIFVKLPDCPQPRFAAFSSFRAITSIFVAAGLLKAQYLDDISQSARFLEREITAFSSEIETTNNVAKKVALECAGKSVVIYGGRSMSAVAYKWKISVNENAKNVAWWGVYPEFNHNEFIGWSSHPVEKPYAVIDLRSSFDEKQVTKRFEISDRILSGQRPKAMVVEAKGDTLLEQIVWATAYGDFVSLYLALLNELDPTPVALIEKMKKEL